MLVDFVNDSAEQYVVVLNSPAHSVPKNILSNLITRNKSKSATNQHFKNGVLCLPIKLSKIFSLIKAVFIKFCILK